MFAKIEALVARLRSTKFAVEINGFTYFTGLAVPIIFVLYVYLETYIWEIFFIEDVYKSIHKRMKYVIFCMNFCLQMKYYGITVYIQALGNNFVKAMLVHVATAIVKFKEKANNSISSHCFLHMHALP